MKILLLEDEYSLRKSMKEFLEEDGYIVDDFSSGELAQNALYDTQYDLLLLDVNVPKLNGFDLLEQARESSIDTPAIFITSLTEIDSLERGYNLGCCDYVKKPFDMVELKLRVSSALSSRRGQEKIVNIGNGYEYNTGSFTLFKDSEEVVLSKTERMIFDLFIQNRSQTLSTEKITEYVWSEYVDPANVRVQINNLRKKLSKGMIVNVRGVGYKLEY